MCKTREHSGRQVSSILCSQILHVDVGSQAHVVGQVPAIVIGIFVDDDVVAAPVPAIAKANIVRSYAEIEAAEPEAAGTAASEMPNVPATESASEASVLKGMVEMIVRIVTSGVVANPFSVGMDVGRVRMTNLIVEMAVLLGRMRRAHGRGTVRRNMSTGGRASAMLREYGD